jgi:hypothetical protein
MNVMLFAFPGELRWNEQRQAVEFDVKLGKYSDTVFIERRAFQHLLGTRPTPEGVRQPGLSHDRAS